MMALARFIPLILTLGTIPGLASQLLDRASFDWEPLSRLAIQDRGRLKPLDSFARESVLYVTGKRKWRGAEPTETVFGWLAAFENEWQNEAFVLVDYGPLREALGLAEDRKHFTPSELVENERLGRFAREIQEKSQAQEALTPIEKKANEVHNRIGLIRGVASGQLMTVLPDPRSKDGDWFSLAALTEQGGSLPYPPEKRETLALAVESLVGSFFKADAAGWKEASIRFVSAVKDLGPEVYPAESTLALELHYNRLRPFHWSWLVYALAFVLLVSSVVTGKRGARVGGIAALAAGLFLHTYGFVVRCLVSGRPPVTNMYESVIWVTWGCVVFAFAIYARYKRPAILAASSVFAVVGLVLADNVPFVLDPNIHPLEPVLRSNFWLTIHVLTITLSYAAFALSLCLGNVVIGVHAFKPKAIERMQEYSLYMYRAMQIGVILLAAGTILGGVWADYSWGRFWGWDPKEVWALTALLLYLAVLHGRFTGWLRGFGFAAATVVSFLGVLMAWYGVNFVLGVGLHSYGFGTGGQGWILTYIFLQLAFIGFGYARHLQAKREGLRDAAIFPKGQR